jgi:glucose-1-phosphate thymidylyltransferase
MQDYFDQYYKTTKGGVVFAYHVSDRNRYGVWTVEFDENLKKPSRSKEKPWNQNQIMPLPRTLFYDNSVVEYQNINPSAREGI